MAGAHHLLRLTLAAVRNTPQYPVLRPRDRLAGVPELGRDSAVHRILQHAHAPSAANLPRNLAPELEVVALVVDRPGAIGFHVDAVGIEHLVQRRSPWQ